MQSNAPADPQPRAVKARLCLCCGKPVSRDRVRYCNPSCKEQFSFKLRWFNNLLRALQTRFATFSFTESVLILNVISSRSELVHTYFYDRTPGKKPAQDIDGMVFKLGDIWWQHLESCNSERRAASQLLGRGHTRIVTSELVKPREEVVASGVSEQLLQLRIKKKDLLSSPDPENTAKAAYRRAVLRHHPDKGGEPHKFRQIHQAYHELRTWLSNPTYYTRRGVPGHWSFIAGKSKWLSPL